MKLVDQIVSWQVPADTSVIKHKLYYGLKNTIINYDSPSVEVLMPTCEYNLSSLPIQTNGEEYSLKLTAIDGVGNESSLSAEKTINLDNTCPPSPIWI